METFAVFLFVSGVVCLLVSELWILIAAFEVRPAWGVVCLLLPPTTVGFLLFHWNEVKRPFLCAVASLLPIVVAWVIYVTQIQTQVVG